MPTGIPNAPPELDERHYEVMKLMLSGMPITTISEKVGISQGVLYRWKNEFEAFKEEYAKLKDAIFQATKEEVVAKLQVQAPFSVDKIVYLRDYAVGEMTQLSAAKDLLDRAGFVPVSKSVTGVALALPPELTKLVEALVKEEELGRKHLSERGNQALPAKEVPREPVLLP